VTETPPPTPRPTDSRADWIHRAWERLRALPGGRIVFSHLLGFVIPYTGSIHPEVLDLEPGFARIRMRDRRSVRNHLRSVHAIALANLAEVTGGLAITSALPATVRGIVLAISVEYIKKARGTLTAECRCQPPQVRARMEFPVTAQVRDTSGEVVARATVRWLLGPVPSGVNVKPGGESDVVGPV
jgi:acyl-coenzyme A thioesterase PaaI-like protein